MTPNLEQSAAEPKRISVPLKIEVSPIALLGWMSELDVAIAAESDAGRLGMAKVLREIRRGIGDLFPPELRLNEERE